MRDGEEPGACETGDPRRGQVTRPDEGFPQVTKTGAQPFHHLHAPPRVPRYVDTTRLGRWTKASYVAALVAYGLFLMGLILYNVDYTFRDPVLAYIFLPVAGILHIGLGLAITALFRRERYLTWAAVAAHAVPATLFWLFVIALIEALRRFN